MSKIMTNKSVADVLNYEGGSRWHSLIENRHILRFRGSNDEGFNWGIEAFLPMFFSDINKGRFDSWLEGKVHLAVPLTVAQIKRFPEQEALMTRANAREDFPGRYSFRLFSGADWPNDLATFSIEDALIFQPIMMINRGVNSFCQETVTRLLAPFLKLKRELKEVVKEVMQEEEKGRKVIYVMEGNGSYDNVLIEETRGAEQKTHHYSLGHFLGRELPQFIKGGYGVVLGQDRKGKSQYLDKDSSAKIGARLKALSGGER